MSSLLILFLIWHLTYAVDMPIGRTRGTGSKLEQEQVDVKPPQPPAVINISSKTKKTEEIKNPVEIPNKTASSVGPPSRNDTNTTNLDHKKFKPTEMQMESGALVRGVMVVLALSVLIIIYMALKTYYGKRNKPTMVRKYGVRTRRSDIEMTPLPLSEDEDDETLFEVGNGNR